ncbi:hypothetical protein PAHAL_5G241600 [Panicum hallii]|uniref:Uncharacterized protein n=1 Tax=Panicum hallii TaxID=206008 RepID=A0A2T8IKZ8_9POAL|nr:hypothetical protein PAHAL_5G241600 [Panicum hallii]
MVAEAATAGDRRRRSRAPAGGTAAGNDDGEEQHLNPFLDAAPSASSRVQFSVAPRSMCSTTAGAGMWPHARGGWKRPVPQRWWRARASCG